MGTFWPLVLPPLFGNAFFIFLSIQFIRGIPTELFDAARVDGASNLQVFRLVVLPVIKPLLVLIGTLQFTATWVDFLGPLLYLRDPQYFTLAVSLYNFFGQNGIDWGPLLAACTLFTAPAVIVFLFGQRYFFASGLTSGIK